jgi:hypothetical protein
MKFQEQCTALVINAVEALENIKYSEGILAAEDEKKKEGAEKQPGESKLKFLKYLTSQNLMACDSLTLDCICQG